MNTKPIKHFIVCLIMCLSTHYYSFAQSTELQSSYNQVVSTLKNYTFISENVKFVDYDEYVTKSMSIKYKHPNLILNSVEGFKSSWAWTSNDKAKPGTHTIEIPLASASIKIVNPKYSSMYLSIASPEGLTYIVGGKKEIIESYNIYGSKLNLEKLCNELLLLQESITRESYTGSLGYAKESPKQSTPTEVKKTINDKYEL